MDYTNASRKARAKRVEEKWHSVNEVSLEEPGRGRAFALDFRRERPRIPPASIVLDPLPKNESWLADNVCSGMWCRKHGVDVLATRQNAVVGLDMICIRVTARAFDNLSLGDAQLLLQRFPAMFDFAAMITERRGNEHDTFLFETRGGKNRAASVHRECRLSV